MRFPMLWKEGLVFSIIVVVFFGYILFYNKRIMFFLVCFVGLTFYQIITGLDNATNDRYGGVLLVYCDLSCCEITIIIVTVVCIIRARCVYPEAQVGHTIFVGHYFI